METKGETWRCLTGHAMQEIHEDKIGKQDTVRCTKHEPGAAAPHITKLLFSIQRDPASQPLPLYPLLTIIIHFSHHDASLCEVNSMFPYFSAQPTSRFYDSEEM